MKKKTTRKTASLSKQPKAPLPGFPEDPTPSASAYTGCPETIQELLGSYGTYEIQPTADTQNTFPAIAQGSLISGSKRPKAEQKPEP